MKNSLRFLPARNAFTLLELLIVVGLMATLALVFVGALSGNGKSSALQAGQATLVNLVSVTRLRAMATGHRTRLLINADVLAGPRFRRTLAVQEEVSDAVWVSRDSFSLPEGIYVLPYHDRIPAGLYAVPAEWTKFGSSAPLESSSLASAPVTLSVDLPVSEAWDYLQFVPAGTISGSGNLVLALGRNRDPSTFSAGDSPVQLDSPNAVRGLALSAYGLPRLINERVGF